MARGTSISENLSQSQIEMMLMLDKYEMGIFTLKELEELSADRFDNINELVENLARKKSTPSPSTKVPPPAHPAPLLHRSN